MMTEAAKIASVIAYLLRHHQKRYANVNPKPEGCPAHEGEYTCVYYAGHDGTHLDGTKGAWSEKAKAKVDPADVVAEVAPMVAAVVSAVAPPPVAAVVSVAAEVADDVVRAVENVVDAVKAEAPAKRKPGRPRKAKPADA